MVHLSTSLKYYKREDIQEAIVSYADSKEIAVKYGDRGFGKRPDALKYPADVLEFARRGASSFHCSEELWQNPLALSTSLKRKELDELRQGWDLILDIDCPILEYSSIAADLVVQKLMHLEIKSVFVKFSGNHGWHIAVPFEAFPAKVHSELTKDLFPDGPKRIAMYLSEEIKPHLAASLLEKESIDDIAAKVGKKVSELVQNGVFNPFAVLAIDTLLISSRHMYRMPYSLNEKSGLVSVPIDPQKIRLFDKQNAKPENVVVKGSFLDRKNVIAGEAKRLIVQAFDFNPKKEDDSEISFKKRNFSMDVAEAVPENYFPPCIQTILKGLGDGKKRSMFILTNFLRSCGWSHDAIELRLKQWNKKNKEELREVYLVGHLRYAKHGKPRLPPNCANKAYYNDLGLCCADNFCAKIRNPANYALLKQRIQAGQGRPRKKQKEVSKKERTQEKEGKQENQEKAKLTNTTNKKK